LVALQDRRNQTNEFLEKLDNQENIGGDQTDIERHQYPPASEHELFKKIFNAFHRHVDTPEKNVYYRRIRFGKVKPWDPDRFL
jgi:hypothetical protein